MKYPWIGWRRAKPFLPRSGFMMPLAKRRILLINGFSRSDQTCPGEMSKTWRLIQIAEPMF